MAKADMTRIVVNISGGKDSTAVYLWALETIGPDFEAAFADTGHEHPITYDFVRGLPAAAAGPPIRWVRADFTADLERKRRFVATKWPEHGVPTERVERALAVLHPTGVPFLDLVLWKGRFPSARARFCTEELKTLPLLRQVIIPAAKACGEVESWVGERAEESQARASRWRQEPGEFAGHWIYRPLLSWSARHVFDLHRRHGVVPNPLYRMGMGRVGCMPCIMCRKDELREIALRFPEEVDRVEEWERLCAEASKRGLATLFAADKDPVGQESGARGEGYFGIRQVAEWAKTGRGGRQYDLMAAAEPASCASRYGLCE